MGQACNATDTMVEVLVVVLGKGSQHSSVSHGQKPGTKLQSRLLHSHDHGRQPLAAACHHGMERKL
jgi:hypothetical protein